MIPYSFLCFILSINILAFTQTKTIMFRNTHHTYFESDELLPSGCCAHTFLPCRPALHLHNPSRIRVYSEPRESSGRKIEVVSARKGQSHAKETTPTNRSLSREPNALASKHQKKIMHSPRVVQNCRSHVQMPLKQQEKVPQGGLKISRVSTHHYAAQTRPSPRKETDPNSTNLPSFQYISEISLISEEFVSQGSAINIVNLITQSSKKPTQVPPSSRIPTQLFSQPTNPIERLMDRKRYQQRAENRKKKLIT